MLIQVVAFSRPHDCVMCYVGDKLRSALVGKDKGTVEIIKRSDKAKGFAVRPRRWVIERTFVWLGRFKRLAKDWPKSIASSAI